MQTMIHGKTWTLNALFSCLCFNMATQERHALLCSGLDATQKSFYPQTCLTVTDNYFLHQKISFSFYFLSIPLVLSLVNSFLVAGGPWVIDVTPTFSVQLIFFRWKKLKIHKKITCMSYTFPIYRPTLTSPNILVIGHFSAIWSVKTSCGATVQPWLLFGQPV